MLTQKFPKNVYEAKKKIPRGKQEEVKTEFYAKIIFLQRNFFFSHMRSHTHVNHKYFIMKNYRDSTHIIYRRKLSCGDQKMIHEKNFII